MGKALLWFLWDGMGKAKYTSLRLDSLKKNCRLWGISGVYQTTSSCLIPGLGMI